MPFERQCGARADVCCVGLPGTRACDGRPDATPRRRLGSFTASNGGDLWPQRGARESLLSGYSPGNATLVRYQAAPTARPTVTNAEPFAMGASSREPAAGCKPGCEISLVCVNASSKINSRHHGLRRRVRLRRGPSVALAVSRRRKNPEWHRDSASRLEVLASVGSTKCVRRMTPPT